MRDAGNAVTVDDGVVTGRNWKRVLAWGVGGVTLLGLGVFLVVVGLDNADKWASVIGLFVGLAGLGMSVYGMASSRRAQRSSQAAGPQRVAGLDAGRDVDVIDGVRGSLRLGTAWPAVSPPGPTATPTPPTVVPGEQSVTDVRANGAIRVVRGVDGNVDIGP